ncbi:CsgG/HfaB family protein [Aliidiomarina maris]|uniref:Curli production assembly/transport component CsgG n=1 Tax=Aliidiomarina maris TaxID=531312 RepID=A0A327WR55_9GAMM|nr:CsgG/HfaB family protein [Aliidiomarina maris]MBA3988423.1 transporter [Idiomarina sp.]MCL4409562.1 CsgG/HfaB family protein [Gammaproteobacteria bacterium]MCL5049861.1 CsgG/HfaB family protein [Bacillota bacterium]RAJ93567.1 curli production assembly/transport component CsgG [Aliidiomarina maris]RUO18801.1 transporter [Aliidiomarina maris]
MRKILVVALTSLVISGCSMVPKPTHMNIEPASIDQRSSTMEYLREQPRPSSPIPVTVYAFRDQTGQYKPQANVSSFSTAVTQGGTSMMMQLLLDSGWFSPLERENLQNLLTERQIHNSARNGQELPPLREARLLLEGGIIAYDTNVTTGGIGMEYFGIGASELYREDQVSVYLRAVDVHTGQVLISVSATKKVFSMELRAGLFRYVSLNRLLEAEGGFSMNEPVQHSVQRAMEAALVELIEKGQERGFWRA